MSVHVELRALADAYAINIDRQDFAAAGGLFSGDGRLVVTQLPPAVGPHEIAAVFPAALGRLAQAYGLDEATLRTHHFVGNHLCDVGSGLASGTTYCLARHADEVGHDVVIMVLRYDDEYVQTPDGWRFQERRIVRQWAEIAVRSPAR